MSLSLLGLIKIHADWKKNDVRKVKKQQIHNKIRLVEQKSAFNMALNDIYHISQKKLMKEKKLIQKYFYSISNYKKIFLYDFK